MMRFRYAYRTSDGIRLEEEIEATSRDAAFVALRAKGIRPIKVVAMDGSKANGEVPRTKKRWIAVAAVCGAILATVVWVLVDELPNGARNGMDVPAERQGVGRAAKPRARKQIGLGALCESYPLETIFIHPSEALLARFAEPGRLCDFDVGGDTELSEDFRDALDDTITIEDDDTPEIAELKRIVTGIKDEARMMVASGKSFEDCIAYFKAQQEMEYRYRESIISGEGSTEYKNRLLAALGLELIEE
jgi:hypothetical protein